MQIKDLPISAKKKLDKWCVLRAEEENRKLDFEKAGSTKAFKYKIGGAIKLLENRKETLSELYKEYEIAGSLDVVCNTEKLNKLTVREVFKVARTAGHFGMFCSCGVVSACDIFFLDESLSQVWAFLVNIIRLRMPV